MELTKTRKKLIEVALPLDKINAASSREKSIRHGHPSTLHLWWARRPLAAARAVLFSQLVDDPVRPAGRVPHRGGTEKGTGPPLRDHRGLGAVGEHDQRARPGEGPRRDPQELAPHLRRQPPTTRARPNCSTRSDCPAFHDPFAGGGAIPLEAQRLGLESYASDLNPVAVLINKAMIEIPPKFAGRAARQPGSQYGASRNQCGLEGRDWPGRGCALLRQVDARRGRENGSAISTPRWRSPRRWRQSART